MGLSVGAATFNERLHLAFRYSHQQFSRASAQAFAGLFLEQMRTALKQVEGRPADGK